jgi:hypothetical protein
VKQIAFLRSIMSYLRGAIRIQGEPMLQRYDWKQQSRRNLSDEITPLLAINGIIVLALLVLALSSPSASEWISAAAQAEFVDGDAASMTPTQIAQPLEAIKIVRSN